MKQIFVTQPAMPPLEDFHPFLKQIWDTKILTNGGPFHQELEKALCEYLGVKYISLFCNGTIALVTALQALGIKGEVITTPYSFVATTHSLVWNNIKPVFVDIDPKTFNLDPNKIEEAITPQTAAVLPVHCYGIPCDTHRIDKIAKKHNLKVIYDAAHAFGVNCHCGSVLNHGDLSVLSFHATKVFNTFEGGAIVSPDARTKQQIDWLKNFGFVDETVVVAEGINGKMNEIQAAFGLLQLKNIDSNIKKRQKIDEYYHSKLCNISGISLINIENIEKYNYGYFPILVEKTYDLNRDQLFYKLKSYGINARRYFFPLITEFPMYKDLAKYSINESKAIAEKVICLPIYPELEETTTDLIVKIIRNEK